MKIMLCGASDTGEIKTAFEEVVHSFGATPMSFLSATHHHENALTSSSDANSIMSVDEADICVFIINTAVGHITWEVEFKHAIRDGKPFIVLCKDKTLEQYRIIKDKFDGLVPDNFKELYNVLYEIEENRALTLVPFSTTEFKDELTRELCSEMEKALRKYTEYQRRKNSVYLLCSNVDLSSSDIKDLIDIVKDEYENKKIRKDIIDRLCNLRVLDGETVLDLIKSPEQGVSRLTIDNLASLLPLPAYTQDFLDDCVIAVSYTEDSGAERRLVSNILDLDLEKGLIAISRHLPLVEIGTKRRLAAELINHKNEIEKKGLKALVLPIAEECHKTASNKGWRDELQTFIDWLQP